LRVQFDAGQSVAALLAQVKANTLQAYEHQDLPFEQVVEAINPVRSMGHSPIFQVTMALNNTPDGGALALPELDVSSIAQPHSTTHFDLSLSLAEHEGQIVGSLEY